MKTTHLLAILVAFAALFVSCGKAAAPEDVVKNFLTAMSKDDISTAKQYCDDATGKLLSFAQSMKNMASENSKTKKPGEIKSVTCQLDGDKGTCKACCDAEGGELNEVTIKKISGKWLVSIDKEKMKKEENQ